MFYDASVLVASGGDIELSNIEMANVMISQYDSASGLVGSCRRLAMDNIKITAAAVYAQSGYLVTEAALIVRRADEISMSNVLVRYSTVSAIHRASGCASECKKIEVTNTTYENCFLYVSS